MSYSVIIRCKNEERWIGHAIQSVIEWVADPEIIIVNNHSEDKSQEIAKMFRKDPDLSSSSEFYTDLKIIDISDYSPGRALNLGVKNSKNPNIIILSAHCVINKFNEQHISELLSVHAGIFAKQTPIFEGKKITPRYLWSHFGSDPVVNMYSHLEERHFFHNAASAFKKELLLAHPFNENLVGKEDRYWAEKIVNNGMTTYYEPNGFRVEHHYTNNGNTWKGVG